MSAFTASLQAVALGGARHAPHSRTVDAGRLRAAMGMFATGVTVITTADEHDRPFGTTANAVSSVSLRPPLVLACLREESETLAALLVRRRFAINILHSSQSALSDRFAARARPGTWDAVAHRLDEGIPVLEGAIATLRCELHDLADGGDHAVVVGHVVDLRQTDPAAVEPLLFFGGAYRSLGAPPPPPPPPSPSPSGSAPARPPAPADATEIALPSRLGPLRALSLSDDEHQASVAVLTGEPHGRRDVLVYAHPGCVLGDALGSTACAGRARLLGALGRMRDDGVGVAVYHRDAGFGACCLGGEGDADELSDDAIDALVRAVAALDLRAVRLLATDIDARRAARAGVPIGEVVRP